MYDIDDDYDIEYNNYYSDFDYYIQKKKNEKETKQIAKLYLIF